MLYKTMYWCYWSKLSQYDFFFFFFKKEKLAERRQETRELHEALTDLKKMSPVNQND